MTKRAIVDEVLDTQPGIFGSRAMAEGAVDAVFSAVSQLVDRGETVQIRGFGSFRIAEKKGRMGRNPQTGAPISIPAKREMKFRLPRRES